MREKFMAIDVGLKRIGLAFGFGEVVTPLEPVLRKNRNQARQVKFTQTQSEMAGSIASQPLSS